jgi:glycosyltransferase involved in cell wall biosynthesis
MQTDPLVSIVLPTFNGSRYLDQSIRSCIEQTYRNWELIIVDDHSTDSTPDIIEHWTRKEPRIGSIRNQTNLRLPGSLNRGFKKALGSYFTWTSDDNLYRPAALRNMVDFLETNPDSGLVYTDFCEIDDTGKIMERVRADDPGSLAFGNSVRACFLYRRAVAEQVGGYREDLCLVEDWDYWLRMARVFAIEVLHIDSYLYRWHGGSLTSTQPAQVRAAIRKLLAEHLPEMKWAGEQNRASGYIKLTSLAEKDGDVAAAKKYFREALRLAPMTALRYCRRQALAMLIGDRLASAAARVLQPLFGRDRSEMKIALTDQLARMDTNL